jgi:hypothetical protein
MNFEPSDGVPDDLYVTLHSRLFRLEPGEVSPEELAVARVLRVHRDWLNGGFDQTLGNLESSEQPFADYVQAYSEVGLTDAARIVAQAASEWPPDTSLENSENELDPYEQLDQSYLQLTYPDDLHDRIEAAIVEYIGGHREALSDAIAEAED